MNLYSAMILLVFFASIPNKESNAVKILNKLLDSICPWRISFKALLDLEPADRAKFKIPPFEFGPVDIKKVEYSLKKAMSYPQIHRKTKKTVWAIHKIKEDDIKGKFSVSRSFENFQLINFEKYGDKIIRQVIQEESAATKFLTVQQWYRVLVASRFLDLFWKDFERIHLGMVDFGFPIIDVKRLEAETRILCVAECLDQKRHGFAFLRDEYTPPPIPDWKNVRGEYLRVHEKLKSDFTLDSFNDSEIHPIIKNFCRYTYLGIRELHGEEKDKKYNESFMSFFIAIELILGERHLPVSQTIPRRLAAILCERKKDVFLDKEKRVVKLYDMRSRFVHSGTEPAPEVCLELKNICREVLECLLRVQKPKENHCSNFHGKWLEGLDLIRRSFKDDENLDEKIFENCGVT